MGRLDIRLDKQNLGHELELGIVADVLQIRNLQGNFPDDPFEQEVVIPAGVTSHREVEVPDRRRSGRCGASARRVRTRSFAT
jgi:hypothetical protein